MDLNRIVKPEGVRVDQIGESIGVPSGCEGKPIGSLNTVDITQWGVPGQLSYFDKLIKPIFGNALGNFPSHFGKFYNIRFTDLLI